MNSNTYLIHGFHPYVDIPSCFKQTDSLSRVAMVFCPSDANHQLEDTLPSILSYILTELIEKTQSDSLLLFNEGRCYSSFGEFLANEQMKEEDDTDIVLPENMHFLKSNKIIIAENTEFWVNCGGPKPYSDSYTFSFYSTNNYDKIFDDIYLRMCDKYRLLSNQIMISKSYKENPTCTWVSNIHTIVKNFWH